MTAQPDSAVDDRLIPFADCWIHPDAQQAALEVLRSGWVTTGEEVRLFEEELAASVGAGHGVGVTSCTQGLELALCSLGLGPGARVLVSTMTFCGAAHAILHAGLLPVLVDVDPVTAMPTPETTARASAACGGADAMMVVHWAGDPCDVEALAEAAGIPLERVVEDAAHALGAERSRPVGDSPGTSVFSFYATKNLPIGEGCMITTHSAERAEWMRAARLHGMSTDAWRRYLPGGSWRYDVRQAGLKANMSDVQAAIGRAQLRRLPEWQQRRRELAGAYDALLADQPIGLPHRPEPDRGSHAWHLYAVRVPPHRGRARDDLMAALEGEGIGTSVHFTPLHQLRYFRPLLRPDTPMTGADLAFEQLLSLPLHPRLTTRQVERVCSVVGGFLESGTGRTATSTPVGVVER
jgi:dTDP-4-amino-4,6-dideoxygalactose transaminase